MGVIASNALAIRQSAYLSIARARTYYFPCPQASPWRNIRGVRTETRRIRVMTDSSFRLPWGLDYRYVLPVSGGGIPRTQSDELRLPGPSTKVSLERMRAWKRSQMRQAQSRYNQSTDITRHYRWPDAVPPRLWAEKHANVPGGFDYGDTVNVGFPTCQGWIDDNVSTLERNVLEALRSRDAHSLLASLVQFTHRRSNIFTSAFLANLAGPIFSEILRLLDPRYFVERWSRVFEELRQYERFVLKLLPAEPSYGYERFCLRFLGQIGSILETRRGTDTIISSDWVCLLKCARYCGHKQAAQAIWTEMQYESARTGVAPSVECCNHYLWTMTSSDRQNASQRFRLRLSQHNTFPRQWAEDRQPPWVGHSIGTFGISQLTLKTFEQMVQNGITADEETYCCVITGLGKEGDLKGISNIFQRVWKVDPEDVTAADAKTPVYTIDSILRPSKALLLTICHTYGSNNDLKTALALIGHFSEQYNLQLDLEVWEALLNWVNVSAKSSRSEQKTVSPFPRTTMMQLWATMISEHHEDQLDLRIVSHLIATRFHYRRRNQAEVCMRFALKLHLKERQRFFRLQLSFIRTVNSIPSSLKAARIRYLTFLKMRLDRDKHRIKEWVKSLVFDPSWSKNPRYMTVGIPNMIMEWAEYLPATFSYFVVSGKVEFPLQARLSILNGPCSRLRPSIEVHPQAASMRRGVRNIRYVRTASPSYPWKHHTARSTTIHGLKPRARQDIKPSAITRRTRSPRAKVSAQVLQRTLRLVRIKMSCYGRQRQICRNDGTRRCSISSKVPHPESIASRRPPAQHHVSGAIIRALRPDSQTHTKLESSKGMLSDHYSESQAGYCYDSSTKNHIRILLPLSELRRAPQAAQDTEYRRLAHLIKDQRKAKGALKEEWAHERVSWENEIEGQTEAARTLMGKMDGDAWAHL